MENSYILPMYNPIFKTWGDCHLMSIISDLPHAKEWIAETFIQIFGFTFLLKGQKKPPNYHFLNLHNPYSFLYPGNAWDICPFIQKLIFSRKMVSQIYGDVESFIENMISNGYYIALYLNRIFEPNQYDPGHFGMIYGYDKSRRLIFLADHYTLGKYDYYTVDIEKIQKAYNDIDDILLSNQVDAERKDEFKYIYLIKPQDNDYTIRRKVVLNSLGKYLEAKEDIGFLKYQSRFFQRYENYVFGIETYQSLIQYFIDIYNEQIGIDWRTICFFQDHKKAIALLLQCLNSKENIRSEWHMVETEFEIILFSFLKYCNNNDKKTLLKIISKLCTLYDKERYVLNSLINTIEQ